MGFLVEAVLTLIMLVVRNGILDVCNSTEDYPKVVGIKRQRKKLCMEKR